MKKQFENPLYKEKYFSLSLFRLKRIEQRLIQAGEYEDLKKVRKAIAYRSRHKLG